MKVALVTNPGSARNRKDPALRGRLLTALGDGAVDLVPDGRAGWAAVARGALEVDVVAVSGGDGSVHCLLSALAAEAPPERWPAVALLRAGTMNTLARNLGVRGRAEQIAARWRDARTVEVPCLRVGPHVGFLFGVGVQVGFLRTYYAGRTGPLGGAWLLARVVAGVPFGTALNRALLRRHTVQARCGDETWTEPDWLAIGAQTVPDLGLGFHVCAHTPTPGRLEAYGFGGTPWSIVANLVRMARRQGLRGRGVRQALAEVLELRSPAPMEYMVDGDVYEGGDTLRVQVAGSVRMRV